MVYSASPVPEEPEEEEQKNIRPNGNFTISDSGVTYIYNQYEIGPYVMGTIKVTVPWDELEDLLQ